MRYNRKYYQLNVTTDNIIQDREIAYISQNEGRITNSIFYYNSLYYIPLSTRIFNINNIPKLYSIYKESGTEMLIHQRDIIY